jgi:hypothetical protein
MIVCLNSPRGEFVETGIILPGFPGKPFLHLQGHFGRFWQEFRGFDDLQFRHLAGFWLDYAQYSRAAAPIDFD